MKESVQQSRRAHILRFIEDTRQTLGSVPNFIHNAPSGGLNYSSPVFDDNELVAIIESVLFGEWLSGGESVRQFERAFSEKFRHRGSVMVNSGSSANLLMIASLKKVLEWQDGDEVILSVVGFPTTLSAVTLNGLSPSFIDIEFDTLNFDVNRIADKITSRTKAIFVSPVLGNPPDFDILKGLCDDFGLALILDDCDSLGSLWRGRYLSEYAIASSCSFYPSHHISTGQGGMISSNNKEVINTARSMAMWGRACVCSGVENMLSDGSCGHRFSKWIKSQDMVLDHRYIFDNVGYNLQPLDLQGAIGLAQLEKFDTIKDRRMLLHDIIKSILLLTVPDIESPSPLKESEVSWFGVPIVCPDKEYKTKLVSHLESNKIQTRNYFAGNILLHKAYSHLDFWGDYPIANKVLERVFFLGCSPNYNNSSISYLHDVLTKFKP